MSQVRQTSESSETGEADLFDVVTPPSAVGAREDAVRVELAAPDAAALRTLAVQLGLAPAQLWRAGWAATLARLI
ncbi:MAG TPA: hypothetical protein VFP84_39375, partial [Kofleriaceae bacterium]|nr:hypothetical protein [Kofleriaceae bacterium]